MSSTIRVACKKLQNNRIPTILSLFNEINVKIFLIGGTITPPCDTFLRWLRFLHSNIPSTSSHFLVLYQLNYIYSFCIKGAERPVIYYERQSAHGKCVDLSILTCGDSGVKHNHFFYLFFVPLVLIVLGILDQTS